MPTDRLKSVPHRATSASMAHASRQSRASARRVSQAARPATCKLNPQKMANKSAKIHVTMTNQA